MTSKCTGDCNYCEYAVKEVRNGESQVVNCTHPKSITNADKYKTAEERTGAFLPFCKENLECKGGFVPCVKCQFDWLEREADDEKISEHED